MAHLSNFEISPRAHAHRMHLALGSSELWVFYATPLRLPPPPVTTYAPTHMHARAPVGHPAFLTRQRRQHRQHCKCQRSPGHARHTGPSITHCINQNAATAGYEMYFAPSTFGAGGPNQNTSRIKHKDCLNPHFLYDCPFPGLRGNEGRDHWVHEAGV